MALLPIIALALALGGSAQEARPAAECHEWHACRQLALDALARGEYEHFHDLAWRTVQTGPARDPDLMYLLARAQSLSGRPHDALVMLDRLADMGVATDAATNDDFKLVRTLREWPDLETKICGLTAPAAKLVESPAPEPAKVGAAKPEPEPARAEPEPAAPAASEPGVSAVVRHPVEDAVRVPDVAFSPRGLAYDAVSSRFVVADPAARKLVIFDERSHHAIDLVRASSAGFTDIAAFEIDPRRGDLWVASGGETASDGAAGPALHKLQLVSGRPLGSFAVPATFDRAHFDDVAVTPAGVVLMLDSSGRRILAFDPVAHSFTLASTIDVEGATSLAPADDRTVYVAHRDGILRVDLPSRAAVPLHHAADVTLAGFARIRWSRGALVGVQRRADGSYGVVEVKLGNGRTTVRAVADAPIADPTAVTLSDGNLYVLTRSAPAPGGDIVVQRIQLR